MSEFDSRDLLANGTHFIFADGWRKCFASAKRIVSNEAQARSLVERLLAGLSAARFLGTRHISAWEIDAQELEVTDSDGIAWRVSLFLDDGDTVIHKVAPAK